MVLWQRVRSGFSGAESRRSAKGYRVVGVDLSEAMPAAMTGSCRVFLGVAAVIILAGFLPSYFLPLAAGSREFTWQIHFHAVCMVIWLTLVVAQAFLIQKGSVGTHRRIGRFSFVLVPILIVAAVSVIRWSVLKNLKTAPESNVLAFAWVSVTDLAAFVLFYGIAISNMRRPETHSRFMIAATLTLSPPALVRIISRWFPAIHWATPLQAAVGVVVVLFLALMLRDKMKRGVCPAYPFALGAYLFIQWTRPFVERSAAWQTLAAYLFA